MAGETQRSLGGMIEAVKRDPTLDMLQFTMHSEWKGGLPLWWGAQ